MRRAAAVFRRREREMRGFTASAVAPDCSCRRRLAPRREHKRAPVAADRSELWQNFIRERVDRYDGILVFQSNVDARSISRSPNAVRQIAGRNRRINSGFSPRRKTFTAFSPPTVT
jgi:hypothetical protein